MLDFTTGCFHIHVDYTMGIAPIESRHNAADRNCLVHVVAGGAVMRDGGTSRRKTDSQTESQTSHALQEIHQTPP
jgi:hypothetical protein